MTLAIAGPGFPGWPIKVKRITPYQQGMDAFDRGVRWDACPRFDTAHDRWMWQRGWGVASREAMRKWRATQ